MSKRPAPPATQSCTVRSLVKQWIGAARIEKTAKAFGTRMMVIEHTYPPCAMHSHRNPAGLKLTHKWIHGSTRLFLFASIESVYRLNCALVESKKAAHPEHGNSNLIVTYDFAKVPGYPDDVPAFLTVAEYLHVIDERGREVRGAYGRNRLEDVIRQLTTQADMRVIEGQFRVGGRYLWVVVRMRVPKDQAGNERHDLARMVGGFSYLGPKERNGTENAVPQHTGFCQVPNCRCDYGQ